MSYNTILQNNNSRLRKILDKVVALSESSGTSSADSMLLFDCVDGETLILSSWDSTSDDDQATSST